MSIEHERAIELYFLYSCTFNKSHKSFAECLELARQGVIHVKPKRRNTSEYCKKEATSFTEETAYLPKAS